MTEPRIYVASLSDYNAGRLHGVWIDAAQEPDAIWAEINAMLTAGAIGAEEHAIHDFEGFGSYPMSEYESIENVSRLALAIKKHGLAVAAYVGIVGSIDAVDNFEEAFLGEWDNVKAYAWEYLDGTGTFDNVNPMFETYFDVDAFARDMQCNGDISVVETPGYNVWIFATNI